MVKPLRAAALLVALLLPLAATTAAAADPVRPFAGTTTGADSYGPPTCPGATWQYSTAGPGHFTHLGLVSIEVTHCTWLDSPASGHFGPGTATLTAANGDTLVLSQSGTFDVTVTPDGLVSDVDLDWYVIGGTGRFEDASGEGSATVVTMIATDTTMATYTGEIAY
jgi:hypothetical protein